MVSLPMAKPKFDPQEMSVKEVEFVRNEYQVEPEVYCQIKERVWDEMSAKAKEDGAKAAREEAKKTAKEELKQELTRELMPDLVAKAEKKAFDTALKSAKEELEPKLRTEIVEQYRKDWEKELLTEADRKAFEAALRDVEVESLMYATSASKEADREGVGTGWSKRVRHGLLAASLVGLGPFSVWLLSARDWHTVSFWLTALPYLVVIIYCAIMAYYAEPEKYDRKTKAEELRKLSSDYLMIVSQAKLVRHLHLSTKIRRDVQKEFDSLVQRKSVLDEKYQPSVDLLDEVKPKVRVSLSEEIDPAKIYAEEFEEQLKEKKAG
jgi:hypothetical protein